jgi:hypothetical protein
VQQCHWGSAVFIVQGKPREPEGIVKVVAKTRPEALQAANNLLKQGMVLVTVIADGRIYTIQEFALTIKTHELALR